MKRSTRLFTLLLASLTVFTLLDSCGSKVTDNGGVTSAEGTTAAQETTAPAETKNKFGDDLHEEMDLGGYTYRILTYDAGNVDHASWRGYFNVDEENGEVLNDAAVARNREVEERMNVVIDCIEKSNFGEEAGTLSAYVLSDEDVCDVAVMQNSLAKTGTLLLNQMSVDVKALPDMDLSQPYYLQSANDIFTLKGKQYLFSGDMMTSLFSNTFIWTNMDKWNELKLEDPYKIVDSGKWTMDKCFSLAKGAYKDVNGDGSRDESDFYGIVGVTATLAYAFHSCNGSLFEAKGDDFKLTVVSDRNVSILDRLVREMDNPDSYITVYKGTDHRDMYFGGSALMFLSGTSMLLLRDAQFTAGILPFPKYDDEQAEYRSFVAGALLCVPVTNRNTDKTGPITEALFSASARTVRPAFREQYINLKVLQDEGSARMLAIIHSTSAHIFVNYVDPAGSFGGITMITNLLGEKSTNLASKWESVREAEEKGYKELFEKLK